MNFEKNDHLCQDDGMINLSMLNVGSTDHTGMFVASLSALIIILISELTADSNFVLTLLDKG